MSQESNPAYEDVIQAQKAIIEKYEKALDFYANPLFPGDNHKKGTRIEFGCGCCSGVIDEDNGCVDYDDSVQGLTAREALGVNSSS